MMMICTSKDWQALLGINLNLAVTGQEEIQWKVYTKLGLNNSEIRKLRRAGPF